jgi:hypothetical protein
MTEYNHQAYFNFCTSGFAIWQSGRTFTTTAAHCADNDWVDASLYCGPTAPPTTEWYGEARASTAMCRR